MNSISTADASSYATAMEVWLPSTAPPSGDVETTINGRCELNWLIYNAPPEHEELVLNGVLEGYLKRVASPYSGIGWDS